MAMNQELYRQVLWSVDAAQKASTSSVDRKHAFELLETFKARDDCSEYAFYILTNQEQPQHNDAVRHFALHCLEQIIMSRWNSMPVEQHQRYRVAVLELMEEALYVKEKIAALVTEVAMREFPQRWESLLQDLESVWATGQVQAELALLAFSGLVENCMDSDFNSKLPSQRRDDILKGLNLALPSFMSFIFAFMGAEYEVYRAGDAKAAAVLLNRSMCLLQRLMPWAPFELTHHPDHDFLQVFVTLLAEEPLRYEALVCLREATSRKLPLELFERLLERLPPACAQLAELVISGSVTGSPSELMNRSTALYNSLQLFHCLMACLSGLIYHGLTHITEGGSNEFLKSDTARYRALESCIQLFVRLLHLPSYKMAQVALQPLVAWFKDDRIAQGPSDPMDAHIPLILSAYAQRLVKVRWDDDGFTDDSIANEEFFDIDGYNTFTTQFRSPCNILLQFLSERYPVACISFMVQRLSQLLRTYGTGAEIRDHLDSLGHPTKYSDASMQFEGFSIFVAQVLTKLPEWSLGGPQEDGADGARLQATSFCISSMRQVLESIVTWQPAAAVLLNVQLTLMEATRRLLRYHSSLLGAVLERCFSSMEFDDGTMPNCTTATGDLKLSDQSHQVRKRAAACCISTAKAMPDLLVQIMGELCQQTQALQSRGRLLNHQLIQLGEMLVIVNNAVPGLEQRQAFLGEICSSALADWTSEAATAMLASPQTLLHALGVDSGEWSDAVLSQAGNAYKLLEGSGQCLVAVGRRVAATADMSLIPPEQLASMSLQELSSINPFVTMWRAILPNLLSLIRCIHMIWEPSTKFPLLHHPDARLVLSILPHQMDEALRGGGTGDHGKNKLNPELTEKKHDVRKQWAAWLSALRILSHQLWSLACTHRTIFLATSDESSASNLLQGSILVGMEHMEHRHLSGLLSASESYVSCCPPNLYGSHLRPLVVPLLLHLLHRLSTTWRPASVAAAAPAEDAELQRMYMEGGTLISLDGEVTNEQKEVINDRWKREATRACIDFIQLMLGLRGGHGPASSSSGSSGSGLGAAVAGAAVALPSPKDGSNKDVMAAMERRKLQKEALTRYVLVEDPQACYPIVMTVVAALSWPDAHTCNRAIMLAQRVVQLVWRDVQFHEVLGRDMFGAAVTTLILEPKWMAGLEWSMLALARDIYVRLVLGQECADVSQPEPGTVVTTDLPRKVLLSLNGVPAESLAEMERKLAATLNAKEQRGMLRDILRQAAEHYELQSSDVSQESLLRARNGSKAILDLPDSLSVRLSSSIKELRNQYRQVRGGGDGTDVLNYGAGFFGGD